MTEELGELLREAERADEIAAPELIARFRTHPDLTELTGSLALRASRLLASSGQATDLPDVARLAKLAHDEGIDGAGLVYAEAADKLALFSGQPQPYGTVMVEHQGDVVQPPVDPTTNDFQRAQYGVPPLSQLLERVETVARQLAVERAGTPDYLPPGQRYCRVWNDPDPVALRARREAEGAGAWADGDVITFVAESAVPVAVTPVFPIPSWDAGDGLQVLSLRIERLDEAVITYTFTPLGGAQAMDFKRGSHDGRFRGPKAPPEAASNEVLVGTMFEHALESRALGEPRRVTIYQPPNYHQNEMLPVVYATDGGMFAPYARRLDAAIEARRCPRVVVVAAHAAPADQVHGNLRALEYLLGFDDRRFDAHQRFFVDELAAWAESELGVPSDPALRAVFGCSDGGGHALTTGRLHHHRFAHIIAYSTGMPPEPTMRWNTQTHPFVHLCAGTLEGAFHQATEAWAGYLHVQGAPYHFTERVAGHDLIQWCEELPIALVRAWG